MSSDQNRPEPSGETLRATGSPPLQRETRYSAMSFISRRRRVARSPAFRAPAKRSSCTGMVRRASASIRRPFSVTRSSYRRPSQLERARRTSPLSRHWATCRPAVALSVPRNEASSAWLSPGYLARSAGVPIRWAGILRKSGSRDSLRISRACTVCRYNPSGGRPSALRTDSIVRTPRACRLRATGGRCLAVAAFGRTGNRRFTPPAPVGPGSPLHHREPAMPYYRAWSGASVTR